MDSFLTPYDLSNSGQENLQFTPFWGVPKPAPQTAFVPELFCLTFSPGEIAHSNLANRELSNDVPDLVVR